jgi:dehydrogenase/reductase SDR family member 7B
MFHGKVFVVTGSTQGIGRRLAEILAAGGAHVVINARNEANVRKVTEELRSGGASVFGLAGDISDYDFCLQLKKSVMEQFGRIDFLINNAALASKGTLKDSEHFVLEQIYRVNVLGSLYPSKAFLDEIVRNKGGIIFISSLAGIVGLPGYLAYSGTKRSIVALAESLRNEVAGEGVFIGLNFPGFTENDDGKTIVGTDGEPRRLPKRDNVKAIPVDKTAGNIIRQIERRRFRSYTSFTGRMVQLIYSVSPSFCLFIIKKNRDKILAMD